MRTLLTLFATLLTRTSPAASATLRPEAIEAHLRFLADDLLEGREAASHNLQLNPRHGVPTERVHHLQPLDPPCRVAVVPGANLGGARLLDLPLLLRCRRGPSVPGR